jgi:hypothetical protein
MKNVRRKSKNEQPEKIYGYAFYWRICRQHADDPVRANRS